VVQGKTVTTEEIPAYCGVALAGLGWLPDTIMTRAVVVRMRRRAPNERVEPYRRRDEAARGHALRDQLAAWAAAHEAKWAETRPDMPDAIVDRDADVWEALLVIADAAGGEWPKRARAAAVELVKAAKARDPSLGIRLLADLRTVFIMADDAKAMFTTDILKQLRALDDAPWDNIKGDALDARGLAWRLHQFDVESKQVRVGDVTGKGYRRVDLHDVWVRYLVPLDKAAKAAMVEAAKKKAEEAAQKAARYSKPAPRVPRGVRLD
jgi:hypothetical protein